MSVRPRRLTKIERQQLEMNKLRAFLQKNENETLEVS
jgi:hypothetical protein